MFFKKNLIFIFKFEGVKYDKWITYCNPDYHIVVVDVKTPNRWKNIARLYDKYKYLMFFYKTISFVDCDINISSKKLKEYFEIFEKYKLNFSSPSYKNNKSNSFFSKKKCFLRNVNCLPRKFVTFNFNSLRKSRKHLSINDSGSGVEWVIPKVLNYIGVSIIDRISVKNEYVDSKKKIVIKDLVAVYNKFNLENLYNIEFSRVDYDEEKCWCCYVDVSLVKKAKFSRPSRRSNGCCDNVAPLSGRMMSSTTENTR